MTEYMHIDTPEVAKLMRKDLRDRFPHTKFSIRCASGTARGWINVSWTDGPVESEVTPYLRVYQSSQFNGMTDSYDRIEDDLVSVDPSQMPVLRHYFCCGVLTHREVTPAAKIQVAREIIAQNPHLADVVPLDDIDPETITANELYAVMRAVPRDALNDLRFHDRALYTDDRDGFANLIHQAQVSTDLTPEPEGAIKTANGRTFYRTDPDGTVLVKRSRDTAWEESTAPIPGDAQVVTRDEAIAHTEATGRCLACNRPIANSANGFGPKCNRRFR